MSPQSPRPPTDKSNTKVDEAWVQRLRTGLDQTNTQLDDETVSALQHAREEALRLHRTQSNIPAKSKPLRWAPVWAGGALATALAIAVFWPQPPSPTTAIPNIETSTVADLAVAELTLLGDDDFLLLEEDLEFYAWVEDELNITG